MATRSKKGLKGSIDDVLGGLLDQDDAATRKTTLASPLSGEATGRPRGIVSTSSKRSIGDDEFFRNLAQEAGGADGEESDVSDVDPLALLQSMQDMDDMDADLFGAKNPRSAASRTATKDSGIVGVTGDSLKSAGKTGASGKEISQVTIKKQLSAPADSSREYRKLSFDDFDDPLAGLLSDEEDNTAKKHQGAVTTAVSEHAPSAAVKETPVAAAAKPTVAPRKKDELTFEDDSDDLMDALGFGDSPVVQRKEQKTGESEPVRPARSKLDELLGRGTPAKHLERPTTGERKEFKLDAKYQKQPEDPWAEDEFVFGSYQPTMSSTPEGRHSRRQSVRFSSEDINEVKPDQKSRPTTPATPSPARGGRNGGDWLGLKDEIPEFPLKEATASSKAVPSSPVIKRVSTSRPPSGVKVAENKMNRSALLEPDATPAEDDNWLSNALSRKKALKQEKLEEKQSETVVQRGQEERPESYPRDSKPSTAPRTHQEASSMAAVDADELVKAEAFRSPALQEIPKEAVTIPPSFPKSQEPQHAVSSQRHTAISRPPDNNQPLKVDFVNSSKYEKHFLSMQQAEHQADVGVTHTQLMELMSQIRKLELERDQQKILLESLQLRHREDLELIENAHRNRLKVLEQSAQQREERLQKENQELSAQYMSRCQSTEEEKSQLLAQYQRKLDEFEKEKTKEIERLRELQRKSIQEMQKDHEEQLQRLKRLKDQEIDAVTSASSHTRSLNGVIEQMEGFSSKLHDLSYKVESTHQNTSQELEIGARQRDDQLRVLQERLTRQQRDMEDERSRLHEVITKMETRLSEQARLLEQERWRVNAEQSKVESLQRSLEEQRRVMTQQLSMEREELERAKSTLLEEQQSVMHRCAEERRKLAAEWSDFHTQQKLIQERAERDVSRVLQIDSQREGAIMSFAKEQAQLKIQASELRLREEQLCAAKEVLEQERQELKLEKERVNAMAQRIRQRAEEIESMSKLASQKYEEGEKALLDAQRVESDHQCRLRTIHQQMERLRIQEQHLHEERINMAQHRRQLEQLRRGLPANPAPVLLMGTKETSLPRVHNFPQSVVGSVQLKPLPSVGASDDAAIASSGFHAKLALLKYTAARDRDFLEDEQHFLDSLKKSALLSTSQTA
ncbi:fas-binding factor 1 isoform X2 [Pleurodeles waltl]|uniref:fas-binding factor 1 isoform X2 n=1 Tax=Pleurodeles waltl TaxID=8319 RepID=UPI003709B80C